ncbi:type I secretion system permease/ATPase [Iodobacter fluviatilis]|uniref:Cyclolysin secretion/processing ATP-binding protein CyaB n=1 Tax=Iodobacter fluviatilis TaxID=537 RepID=A0A377SV66_9NEIS|nr:type I secretion system permease/ATPase [Iodobacter fluviatilis]TCU82023.1 ATP-binding cassette subfamily C protein LapB [Iodobacter fluviatilis]STR44883.1 RTX-I toxin determinant B [Iodobacter fluviatilis]
MSESNPSHSKATDRPDWRVGEHQSRFDPLLDCLAELTRIHGQPWTCEALSAGLPLTDNLLSPSLVPRAAARAGLSARVVRRALQELPSSLFPVILLLKDRGACLLLEWTDDGMARICFPETGESSELVDAESLAALHNGIVIFVRPKFRFEARAPEHGAVRSRHWFWGVVKDNWRLYRDALLAALLINLLALAMPLFSMNVYDRVVPNHALETLWVLAVGALAVLCFDLILRTIRGHIIDVASKRIDVTLSALIMERVLGLRMEARPASVGSFVANLRAFESVRDFIASASITTLVDLPFVLIFLLVMVWISPWLAVPAMVGIVLVVGFTLLAQDKMQEMVELTQRASAQRNATLVEGLVGIETIKVMGAESEFQRRWERSTHFLAQIGSKLKLLSSTTVNFASFISQLVSVVVIIVGVYLLTENMVTMGGIIAASMLSGRALAPLGQVAGLLMQYQNARTSLAGIESHMKLPVERPANSNFLHRESFRGDIEFKNVSFAYAGNDEKVLNNVSFKLKAGEKMAIIGRIGSGKTTIEKLILGLYYPSEGAVLIDGVDTRQIDPAELRRAVGHVPQEPILFYGTLRQNIAMGAPFADDGSILAAAELAGVKEFSDLHPRGFDMLISERGDSLSGGQRQTVSIARAMLNDPPMLLLDEPTSAMDHLSEEKLKARLKAYITQKTLLLVTHRTSLLDLVDRLIVLDQGQVVADGPKAQVIEALQQGRIGRSS